MPRSKQSWINVEDGLPLTEGLVYVCRENESTRVESRSVDRYRVNTWVNSSASGYTVKKWMPLLTGEVE